MRKDYYYLIKPKPMTPPIEFTSSLTIDTSYKAKSLVNWLDPKEKTLLLEALLGLAELEDTNFKIDSTNRKEITSPNGIKVKENPEGDVREYLEGEYKGEQLFTQDAALRETAKVGKKLPASSKTYIDIIEKRYQWNYDDFLDGEKMIFSGWRNPDNYTFDCIDRYFNLRCADGANFEGNRDRSTNNEWLNYFGFSVRCLKD